jgi:hypothetical protein
MIKTVTLYFSTPLRWLGLVLLVVAFTPSQSTSASAQTSAVKTLCKTFIENYIGDVDRVRPQHSAAAFAIGRNGQCYWAAWSGASSAQDASSKALSHCQSLHSAVDLTTKCRVYSVNKKAF